MSAIGSYVVFSRAKFAESLELARNIHLETAGKWLFKKTNTVGLEEFREAWQKSIVKEVDFDYSGYVLGNYLDAQNVINKVELLNEQSEAGTVLGKAFTAGFLFEEPVVLPELPLDQLRQFCLEEYGEADAEGMVEAINAAHMFYQRGLAEISVDNVVVFLIV